LEGSDLFTNLNDNPGQGVATYVKDYFRQQQLRRNLSGVSPG